MANYFNNNNYFKDYVIHRAMINILEMDLFVGLNVLQLIHIVVVKYFVQLILKNVEQN